jgi:ArsR family transcriptional regulator, arsenate/arsenite/antimonite-responsive transcriptional repressor
VTMTTTSPSTPAGPAEELTECYGPTPGTPQLGSESAAVLATKFKALGDANRLMLLATIASGESAEACVCDLTGPLNLGQPTVSHHLKILVDAGFLTREKRGTWSYYSVVPGALSGLCADLCSESVLGGLMEASAPAERNA